MASWNLIFFFVISAFPSWDEPLLKATYTVTMISRSETVNLGNMPAVSEVPHGKSVPVGVTKLTELYPFENEASAQNEWKVTTFEKTPPVRRYPLSSSYFLSRKHHPMITS
jgi:aminopeptidase 2